MLRYALRRIALLPLSLLLLSLLCFGLRQMTPGDPVRRLLPDTESRQSDDDPAAYDRNYRQAARSLGLDRPPFYFSIYNAALPDTLHRVARPEERAMLRALTLQTGNWPAVQNWYRELRRLAYAGEGAAVKTSVAARQLLVRDQARLVNNTLNGMPVGPDRERLTGLFTAIYSSSRRAALLLPAFRWNGADNQYHRWLGATLRGDFGASLSDRRPVSAKIGRAMRWTALLNGLALLLVYLVSLPLGLYAAGHRGGWFDRVSTVLLFLLFGIPSFWLATLLSNFFTTPAFGMDWFPSLGFGEIPEGASWWTIVKIRAAHLFLPVICLAYPGWAYVSRQLRRSAGKELDQAYVKTARLKGLSRGRILWVHVFRNASFPIITMLGGILPALLAGSVVIERIFHLPGMGELIFTSALKSDWPVVITLVLLNGLLTAVGLLVADLGYALADPRLRLNAAKTNAV